MDCPKKEVPTVIGCGTIGLTSPDDSLTIKEVEAYKFTLDIKGSQNMAAHFNNGKTTTVTGNGSEATPFITEVKLDPATGNALKVVAGEGLMASSSSVITAANNGLSKPGIPVMLGNEIGGVEAKATTHIYLGFNKNISFTGEGKIGINTATPTKSFELGPAASARFNSLGGTTLRAMVVEDTGLLGAAPFPVYFTPTEKVFYVAKKYIGPANVAIGGTTTASITGGSATYNAQLTEARMGSREYPYPDPWSARNYALAAIAAGTIKSAYIIVLSGNVYKVGSNSSTHNGTTTPPYNPAIHDVPDVAMSSANATTSASLLHNNVTFEFQEGSGLIYICAVFSHYIGYHVDLTDQPFRAAVLGKGFFHRIYGLKQGYSDVPFLIDNANAIVKFEAKEISWQAQYGFCGGNFAEFYIDIDYALVGETRLLWLSKTRATTIGSKIANHTLKIKSLSSGFEANLYPEVDYSGVAYTMFCYGITLFPINSTVDIKNYNHTIDGRGNELFVVTAGTVNIGQTAANFPHKYTNGLTVYFYVGNYIQKFRSTGSTLNTGGTVRVIGTSRQDSAPTVGTNTSSNNKCTVHIRSAEMVSPLGHATSGMSFEGINNLIVIKSDKMRLSNPSHTGSMIPFASVQPFNPADRNNILMEGWYEDKDQGLMSGGEYGSQTNTGMCKIILRGKFICRTAGKIGINRMGIQSGRIGFALDKVQMYNDGATTTIYSASPSNGWIPCMGAVVTNLADTNVRSVGKGIVADTTNFDSFY